MDLMQKAEVITTWLMQVEGQESVEGAQREEIRAFMEHAIRVLDLLGQAEFSPADPNLAASIESEFAALKKRAARLGLAQGS
jgi:hypothetical protein